MCEGRGADIYDQCPRRNPSYSKEGGEEGARRVPFLSP